MLVDEFDVSSSEEPSHVPKPSFVPTLALPERQVCPPPLLFFF